MFDDFSNLIFLNKAAFSFQYICCAAGRGQADGSCYWKALGQSGSQSGDISVTGTYRVDCCQLWRYGMIDLILISKDGAFFAKGYGRKLYPLLLKGTYFLYGICKGGDFSSGQSLCFIFV